MDIIQVDNIKTIKRVKSKSLKNHKYVLIDSWVGERIQSYVNSTESLLVETFEYEHMKATFYFYDTEHLHQRVKYYHQLVLAYLVVKQCFENGAFFEIKITILMTLFEKEIDSNIFRCENINSGFTSLICESNIREIVIFREEEWLKVAIHEMLHAMDLTPFDDPGIRIKNQIDSHFIKNSNVTSSSSYDTFLSEAYTEFIAQLLYFKIQKLLTGNLEEHAIENSLQKSWETIKQMLDKSNCDTLSHLRNNDTINTCQWKEETSAYGYFIIRTLFVNQRKSINTWLINNNHGKIRVDFVKLFNLYLEFGQVSDNYRGVERKHSPDTFKIRMSYLQEFKSV